MVLMVYIYLMVARVVLRAIRATLVLGSLLEVVGEVAKEHLTVETQVVVVVLGALLLAQYPLKPQHLP
jgi:hypothetical protein